MSTGLPRSVPARLVSHAHALGIDPDLVLARYAVERLLYRLSRSAHAERFVLKGALMLLVWLGETVRPTRDADLLGFGELDAGLLRAAFATICTHPPEPVFLKWKGMEATTEGDFFVRSGPGTVKLPPESARQYIRTRFSAAGSGEPSHLPES